MRTRQHLTSTQKDALKNIGLILVQKAIGLMITATPFIFWHFNILSDDPNGGLMFFSCVPIGLWWMFTKEEFFIKD